MKTNLFYTIDKKPVKSSVLSKSNEKWITWAESIYYFQSVCTNTLAKISSCLLNTWTKYKFCVYFFASKCGEYFYHMRASWCTRVCWKSITQFMNIFCARAWLTNWLERIELWLNWWWVYDRLQLDAFPNSKYLHFRNLLAFTFQNCWFQPDNQYKFLL